MDDRNGSGVGAALERLVAIMAALRTPGTGCPWDLEQTFATIAPYTIEESYEVAQAIADEDMGELRAELGDLLLQVVFHSRIAEETGVFSLADVASAIADKMIRRHPHVFGDDRAEDAAAVKENWEAIKAREKLRDSALSDVALALPALMRAEKLQKRAARAGFDWPDASGPRAKIDEELRELEQAASPDEIEDEVGDLLFAVVNHARHLHVDPEAALRRANAKFEQRFRAMEAHVGVAFADLPSDAKEGLWAQVKAELASGVRR